MPCPVTYPLLSSKRVQNIFKHSDEDDGYAELLELAKITPSIDTQRLRAHLSIEFMTSRASFFNGYAFRIFPYPMVAEAKDLLQKVVHDSVPLSVEGLQQLEADIEEICEGAQAASAYRSFEEANSEAKKSLRRTDNYHNEALIIRFRYITVVSATLRLSLLRHRPVMRRAGFALLRYCLEAGYTHEVKRLLEYLLRKVYVDSAYTPRPIGFVPKRPL